MYLHIHTGRREHRISCTATSADAATTTLTLKATDLEMSAVAHLELATMVAWHRK